MVGDLRPKRHGERTLATMRHWITSFQLFADAGEMVARPPQINAASRRAARNFGGSASRPDAATFASSTSGGASSADR